MSKYDKLKKKNSAAFTAAKEEIKNFGIIADESRRVATVAHNAGTIISDLDHQFSKATKLNQQDIAFLFLATALQCTRQHLIGSLTSRKGHKESAENAHELQEKLFGKATGGTPGVRYRATLDEILHTFEVPYDAMAGSKKFALGGDGKGFFGDNHRYRTLGHDPILGWCFGTANIMTRTLTTWNGLSYHVQHAPDIRGTLKPTVVANASTELVLSKMRERSTTDPQVFGAAIIKQGLHYKSDIFSTAGLPVPLIQKESPELAQMLGSYGIDTGNIVKVSSQAGYAVLINQLIASIHGLFYNPQEHSSWRLYSVKTHRILLYSNILATSSNLLGVACAEAIAFSSGNSKLAKDALNYLDIGGFAVTLHRLFKDRNFIKGVKQEFLENEWSDIVLGSEYSF